MSWFGDLIEAWKLAAGPHGRCLETAAFALAWPVPPPLLRDEIVIDTEMDAVVYVMAVPCPCGCGDRRYGRIVLQSGMAREIVDRSLVEASIHMIRIYDNAVAAGRAGGTTFRLPDDLDLKAGPGC